MDHTIIAPVKARSASEALELSRQFLVKKPGDEGAEYICLALVKARNEGLITGEQRAAVVKEILSTIYPAISLASHLHSQKKLSEACKDVRGYDLQCPEYIKLRDEFINQIRRKLK